MLSQSLLALAAAGLTAAHYTLEYPEWRGDSFDDDAGYTQWTRPCAGIPYGAGNRTDWPISGGSVALSLGHAFNYAFINLGLEEEGNITSFNISLTPQPLNTTGEGTLCLRHLPINIDYDIPEGTNASIQVVKVGPSGNAMYNCADIRLTSEAQPLAEDECQNEDAQSYIIKDQAGFNGSTTSHGDDHSSHGGDSSEGGDDSEESSEGGDDDSAAAFNAGSISTIVGLGMAVVFGMNL